MKKLLNLFNIDSRVPSRVETESVYKDNIGTDSERQLAKTEALDKYYKQVVQSMKFATSQGRPSCRVRIDTLHELDYYDISLVDEAIGDAKTYLRGLGYYVSGCREDFSIYIKWDNEKW